MQVKQRPYIRFMGAVLFIEETTYVGGAKALILVDGNEQVYAKLTVNLPNPLQYVNGFELLEGEFFVKTWSENEEVAKACLRSGFFVDTGKRLDFGQISAHVWKFSDAVLRDITPPKFTDPNRTGTLAWAAVKCPNCGLVFLTEEEYINQMMAADSLWKCPICRATAQWDDDTFEAFQGEGDEE